MNEKKCKHCGGDYALHHFETNQCPLNGVDSVNPIWMASQFEPESLVDLDSFLPDMMRTLKEQNEAIKNLTEQVARLTDLLEFDETIRLWKIE